MIRRAVSLQNKHARGSEKRWVINKSWQMSKHSLLLNLLIRVAFFLGKVSLDLKVHPARLKLKHRDLKK